MMSAHDDFVALHSPTSPTFHGTTILTFEETAASPWAATVR